MDLAKARPLTLAFLFATIATSHLRGDIIETSNGARLVGKIVKIEKGEVFLKTDFAGDIKVKQSMVTAIVTDKPVAVRLANGNRFDGIVSSLAPGSLQIAGPDGKVTAPLSTVAATWAAGQEDPAIVALRHHWTFEADVDIDGKTGNNSQLGTDVAFRATRIGPKDKLELSTAYDRQVTDGARSADQGKVGADYSENFSDRISWFVRDEAGFDRVMGIRDYDIAAAGAGYDVIKDGDRETLTGRAGLSYRYDRYTDQTNPSLSSLGADLEIEHKLKFRNSYLTNRIAFEPAFEDIGNFVISHESAYEIPLLNRWWKLKIGIANDYESKPSAGIEKLDTTYFTRLVLTWGL